MRFTRRGERVVGSFRHDDRYQSLRSSARAAAPDRMIGEQWTARHPIDVEDVAAAGAFNGESFAFALMHPGRPPGSVASASGSVSTRLAIVGRPEAAVTS